MRLVMQRAIGDCALCAVATLLELSYEDVYIHASQIDKRNGKSGVHLPTIFEIAAACGAPLLPPQDELPTEDDRGLLIVIWKRGSKHYSGQIFKQHIVACAYGVVADPSDGLILPVDEYLAREKAKPGAFLEWRS